jgi:hypothetical protein
MAKVWVVLVVGGNLVAVSEAYDNQESAMHRARELRGEGLRPIVHMLNVRAFAETEA